MDARGKARIALLAVAALSLALGTVAMPQAGATHVTPQEVAGNPSCGSGFVEFKIEPVHAAARPGELQRIYVDPAKAAEILGWRPTTELDEGLKQTVAWFRSEG